MKRQLVVCLLIVLGVYAAHADTKPSASDLVGRWNAIIEFGKFKFKMNLKIAPADDGKRIKATMDIPDQGAKDMPLSALLFNYPDVRVEIDQFRTAFNGKLSEDRNAISGEFEEGPGGRPIEVVFKRNTEPEKPEPVKTYTFAPDEAHDIRGYWTGSVEARPGTVMRMGLKVGKLPDGSFQALMDNFDQGATDVPATSVSYSDGAAKMEWELFRLVFESKLSGDGKELAGTWKQGKEVPVKFQRLAKPATALPEGISFVPDKNSPEDIRGHWKGVLEVQGGNKLRLALKLGKLPDGSFAGTMASLDQGARELPASSIGYTNPVVRMEWKGINGVYTGAVNQAGTEIDGTWRQGGPLPLKFHRVESAEAAAKP
jgi:hypothetical protein